MATDIAFAVGVLALLGNRIPKSLLTFLVALAIVDDLGAVTVIALFYTDEINLYFLGSALLVTAIMYLLNLMGIRRSLPYFLLTVVLWMLMEGSGIHATIAGIFAAWTIPAYSRYSPKHFSQEIRNILEQFELDKDLENDKTSMTNHHQIMLIRELGEAYKVGISLLQKLESNLHIPTTYLIIPLFALANAAIPLDLNSFYDALTDPIALGIVIGLVAGKLIGITGSVCLMQKLDIGKLPDNLTFSHIIGVGLIAGIGFIMSIFVSEFAFEWDGEVINVAKIGIFFGSLIAGICGYIWLRFFTKASDLNETSP